MTRIRSTTSKSFDSLPWRTCGQINCRPQKDAETVTVEQKPKWLPNTFNYPTTFLRMSNTNGGADGHAPQPDSNFDGKMSALEISASAEETKEMATRMQQRCSLLLEEMEQFQSHLKQQKKEKHVEMRTFKNSVYAEMKLLNKVRLCPFAPISTTSWHFSSLQQQIPTIQRQNMVYDHPTYPSLTLYGQ